MTSSLFKSLSILGSNVKFLLTDGSIRLLSSHSKYTPQKSPKDSVEASRNSPCDKGTSKIELTLENPDSCKENSSKLVRYDQLHYHISDKTKRVYTPTWIEFPAKFLTETKNYCFDSIDYYAPLPIRTKSEQQPKTTSASSTDNVVAKCDVKTTQKCTKLPSCLTVRYQSSCKHVAKPQSNSKKVNTPTASYSERETPHLGPTRTCECTYYSCFPRCRASFYKNLFNK